MPSLSAPRAYSWSFLFKGRPRAWSLLDRRPSFPEPSSFLGRCSAATSLGLLPEPSDPPLWGVWPRTLLVEGFDSFSHIPYSEWIAFLFKQILGLNLSLLLNSLLSVETLFIDEAWILDSFRKFFAPSDWSRYGITAAWSWFSVFFSSLAASILTLPYSFLFVSHWKNGGLFSLNFLLVEFIPQLLLVSKMPLTVGFFLPLRLVELTASCAFFPLFLPAWVSSRFRLLSGTASFFSFGGADSYSLSGISWGLRTSTTASSFSDSWA